MQYTNNIFDVLSEYFELSSKNEKAMLKSILTRFLIPFWGGNTPISKRATVFEIENAMNFLKNLPINILQTSLKDLEEVFEQNLVEKSNRKTYKCIYKKFVDWVTTKNYFNTEIYESKSEPESENNLFKKTRSKFSGHGIKQKDSTGLMVKNKRTQCLIYPNDYVNDSLKSDLTNFEKYRFFNCNCSTSTVENDKRHIFYILGWLHRHKGIPLEDLRLTSIIQYVKLIVETKNRFDSGEDLEYSKYILAKAFKREEALEIAVKNIQLIEEFLDWLGGHPNSKCHYLNTISALSKFIFKDEVDGDNYTSQTDIPITKQVHLLAKKHNNKAKNTPATVPHHLKSVPWLTALTVLEKLRIQYNTCNYSGNKKRKSSAIINDLQHFLSLAFMLLIPPDRTRTFCELEIGRTFLFGEYANGIFVSKEKMKNGTQGKWYIHLQPEDYKTGKVYGEFWGEIPNYKFSDSTLFYDYINLWVDQGRNYGHSCNHNFFFRGVASYEKLTMETWSHRIKHIFYAETGIPVTPRELRKMYVTFLKDNGATEAELEGAATWMKHSRLIQSKIYDQQNKINKMAPVQNFNQRKLEENNIIS